MRRACLSYKNRLNMRRACLSDNTPPRPEATPGCVCFLSPARPFPQVVFLAASRFGKRSRHIKLFFKDIPRVASFGEKLSVFVAVDRDKDQRRPDPVSPDHSPRAPPRLRHTSPSPLGPRRQLSVSVGKGAVFEKQLADITRYATLVTAEGDDAAPQLCLHLSLPDRETCSEMRGLMAGRIAETQMASINFQKEAYRTSENLRGSELMFGYLLPDEDVTPEERDAVQQIFTQAKMCSYKAGDEILTRGSIERNLYHILRGTTVCLSGTGQVTGSHTRTHAHAHAHAHAHTRTRSHAPRDATRRNVTRRVTRDESDSLPPLPA
jgi:hypothetical protein